MARIDAQFIIQTALDAATADSEGSVIVWAERHGIDPQEMTGAVQSIIEATGAEDTDETTRAVYFTQLGYELRRRQQDEPPSMLGDVKLREYLIGIAKTFCEAQRGARHGPPPEVCREVLELFFNTEPDALS